MPSTTSIAFPPRNPRAPRAPQTRSRSPLGRYFAVVNPVTGHRATLLKSAEGTSDARVEFEFALPARSAGAPRHVHTRITETFTVVSGRLLVEIGARGHFVMLGAGETVTISPGTPHGFRNATDEGVVFRCAVSPGAGFENFIRSLYGLALDGQTDASGMPQSFWQLVLILKLGDLHVPGAPVALQRWLIAGLARLARQRGAERILAAYTNPVGVR
jgi:mannose-6-phosphate isomerase-like protein (cupin superfamily)